MQEIQAGLKSAFVILQSPYPLIPLHIPQQRVVTGFGLGSWLETKRELLRVFGFMYFKKIRKLKYNAEQLLRNMAKETLEENDKIPLMTEHFSKYFTINKDGLLESMNGNMKLKFKRLKVIEYNSTSYLQIIFKSNYNKTYIFIKSLNDSNDDLAIALIC